MTKTVIGKSFLSPEEGLGGLAWVRGEIWTASAKNMQIFRLKPKVAGKYLVAGRIPSPSKNIAGLAWDGQQFYVADRLEKVILRVKPDTGQAFPALDLQKLDPAGMPLVFRVKGSEVTDIAWGKGLLWVTCMAGYSSSVYAIDVQTQRVVRHFRDRGPQPEGISFDHREEYFWTLDASNREFSQFTPQGEWTEEELPSPIARPTTLALDDQDTFWTVDRNTKQVVQVLRED